MASRKKTPKAESPQMGLGLLLPTSTPSTDVAPLNRTQRPEASAVDDGRVRPSLPGLSLPASPVVSQLPTRSPHESGPNDAKTPVGLDLDELDDYDDGAVIDDVPRLRLLDPPRDAPTVIVEMVGDMFEVSRLRDNGTTVACVMWTRKELEELQRRITAALEMDT